MRKFLPSQTPEIKIYLRPPFIRTKNAYPLFLLVLLVFIALLLFFSYQSFYRFLPFNNSPDKVIVKVGEEHLYQRDLDHYLSVYYPKEASASVKSQKAIDESINALIKDSVILQAAKKEGLIEFSKESFDSPNKNVVVRNILVEAAKKKIESKDVDRVSGESISIWFYNASYLPPKMGIEAAKKTTREKIDQLYNELKNEKISFSQAAMKIITDQSLNNIDPSFRSNAYFSFKERPKSEKIFNDPKVDQVVWSLEPGKMSEVLMVDDFDLENNNKPYEALFKIVRVTEKTVGGFADFSAWLSLQKSKYEIVKY
ncbi:MAG: hypothetical protein M1150_00920 [Patescibacteria group bacterium]|nr:hypothetical protein [Patescibacteria group bacterium]